MRSIAVAPVQIFTFFSAFTRARRAISIAFPVASAEWTIRATEWAPSRVKSRSPSPGPREGDAGVADQDLLDDARPLLREEADRLGVAEAGAGREDVLHERGGGVLPAEVDDPALRPGGVAVAGVVGLRDEEDADAPLGEGEGGRQAGDAGADDERRDADPPGGGAHFRLRRAAATFTSRAMSTARTECVSAPTETKSTPARADFRAFSDGHPARGLGRHGGAGRLVPERDVGDGLLHLRDRHVVEEDPLGPGLERLVDLVARPRLGLEEAALQGAVHRAEVGRASRRVPEAAAAVGVVVLDEEGVGEPHPVVRPAAAAHGVLLEERAGRASSCACRGGAPSSPRARRRRRGSRSRRPSAAGRGSARSARPPGPRSPGLRPGRGRSPRRPGRRPRRGPRRRREGARKAKTRGRNAAPATTAASRQTRSPATRALGPKTARVVMSSPSSANARARRSFRASTRCRSIFTRRAF